MNGRRITFALVAITSLGISVYLIWSMLSGGLSPSWGFLVTADVQYNSEEFQEELMPMQYSDFILDAAGKKIKKSFYKGLILAGDITHNGNSEELNRYVEHTLGFEEKIFDGIGNHDYYGKPEDRIPLILLDPKGFGSLWSESDISITPENFLIWDLVRKRIHRVPTNTSFPNLHYSWDWEGIHFVQLNLFPGNEASAVKSDLDPLRSLDFLKSDLENQVGVSGKPVIIIHHYGIDDFSTGISEKGDLNLNGEWWTAEQRLAYWDTIVDYHVVALFTGHQHDCKACLLYWDGVDIEPSNRLSRHIPVFIAGAAREGYFLDCSISGNKLIIKRYFLKSLEATWEVSLLN